MICYLCHSNLISCVDGQVRDMPNLGILKCDECGLIFLESFDHIDNRFYEESKMLEESVSLESWRKDTHSDDLRRFRFVKPWIEKKCLLDFGTGNGQFLEMSRDISSSVAGVELDASTRAHMKKKGISCVKNLEELGDEKFDVVTAFHVLEHLKDPVNFLKQVSSKLKSDGKIIVEVPNSSDALLSLYDSKEFAKFTYWSCHLMYFNETTLKKVIHRSGLTCKSIEQIQRYPLSNHLYWLSQKKPGGHEIWNFLNEENLQLRYQDALARMKACDTIIAEIAL